MKLFKSCVLTASMVIACVSCERFGGGLPTFSYSLVLSIVDTEGNDLIEGIRNTKPEGSIEADFVAPDQYTLAVSPNAFDMGFDPYPPGVILHDTDPTPELSLASPFLAEWEDVWDEERMRERYGAEYNERMQRAYDRWLEQRRLSNGLHHFGIRMTSPRKYDVKKFTYTLTCPHVFGDEEPHEIVTYWRKPSGWTKRRDYYRACYLVEVDGKEFTDIEYTSYEQASYATIVLDR